MDENRRYEEHLRNAERDFESLCRRCGACCGVDEKDPCVKLIPQDDGAYRCSDYAHRGGTQVTVNGNAFECVSIRRIRSGFWPGAWKCGYKKEQHRA